MVYQDSSVELSPSIYETYRSIATRRPKEVAVIDESGCMTTRLELLERADQLAALLLSLGVIAADRIALQLPNSVDFIAGFLAILKSGSTLIPIDRDARESEVSTILSQFECRALIYRGNNEGDRPLPSVSMRGAALQAHTGGALIKLTSGSTGQPKGILTSERNLIADCHNICLTMDIREEDRNLGAVPFSHSYGFSNIVTPLLLQGTAVIATNQYLPLSILELCNRFGATVVPGIPMMFDHLSQLPRDDDSFKTVRIFISAGAPLTAAVSRRFRERHGGNIHSFYGCSECGGIAYDRNGGAVERGFVGPPLEGVTLEFDTQGRLSVKGEAVARGYVRDPDDTGRFGPATFLTDDLARLTADGELELIGRVGDLINTAGKKVNPREVERIILQLKGVNDVRVYGQPAGARGEVVAAVVVADPDVTREKIREICRLHLSSHKVPRIVKLIDAIPVDDRGKVRRSALAEL
ncbi:MAG TPA: class I adenylate-forming enzyme family protein [Thermoanaerobaculia bacterium]|nr:class I adenylate-forming enzyme family protein [Thermoanaerobaculia bacterium]